MYKVLIVDDDILIWKHMISVLNWESLGFELVGEANNGAEALLFLNEMKIDLVITDISMPIMDGVELIKLGKSKYPQIEFLVLSNYNEFISVKSAMKYGALDYLMKYEMDKECLEAALAAAKTTIEEQKMNRSQNRLVTLDTKWREQLVQQFWKSIVVQPQNKEALQLEALNLEIELSNGLYVLLMVGIEADNREDVKWNGNVQHICDMVKRVAELCKYSYTFALSETSLLIVLKYREKSSLFIKNTTYEIARNLKREVSDFMNQPLTMAISEAIYKLDDFPVQFEKLVNGIRGKFYWNIGKIMDVSFFNGFNQSFNRQLMYDLEKRFADYLQKSEAPDAMEVIETIFQEINKQKYEPELVYDYFTEMIISIRAIFEKKGLSFSENDGISFLSGKDLRNFPDLESLQVGFSRFVQTLQKVIRNSSTPGNRKDIKSVIKLVKENYKNNMTLDYVADYVGMSKNYFCTVFKDQTGCGFVEYLNKIRIENAEHLIVNTEKSMNEIAEEVGMTYGNFCKVFKEMKGVKPNQLRKYIVNSEG
ncbi:hypothetical protein A8709_13375 [Paenibacillus pectinilyticus]|uniref:DNA-binding response regulator n=1 Tax=Paenibacillus pectinilyticus TaxID=512399 RepID=A0A1C1A3H2_9BACL|nr:response regulator [Paenibacillus pectinilyticus]OCT15096.1 hypothetical protein A8709_13375 [Paenibacillus pectinilyticus]